MKPNLLTIAAIALSGLAQQADAQNLQFHYDLGHSIDKHLTTRPSATATVEMFKPDRWGNTFLFIDLDFYSRGMAGAYWEISREFNFSKNKQWAAHAEYNGGVTTAEDMTYSSRFQHAVLLGPAWNWHSADFSKTFSIQTLYKYYFKGQRNEHAFNSFQLTAVWSTTFAKGLCTFAGYADLWYDSDVNGKLVFMSEPQFWFNLNTIHGWDDIHLSLGTEVELSNNFIYNDLGQHNRFYAIPTLAAKWTF